MGTIDQPHPVSEYREYPPCRVLEASVSCLWSQAISAGTHPFHQIVLPDGCVDILWIGDRDPIVVGPATRMFIEPVPAGCTIIGVRFRTGTCSGFLKMPASELRDQQIDLSQLWGSAAERPTDAIRKAATIARKIAMIEAALLVRLPHAQPADPMVQAAVARLARCPGIGAGEVARSLGICERQMRRRFTANVGYGPKVLSRIVRLQKFRALAADRLSRPVNLAATAIDLGYADQSHMTREIRALSGLSPTSLLSAAPVLQSVSHAGV